jgi:predicted nucleic acid-binding protein
MRVLIDTNVIIDALQSRKGFKEDADFVMLQSYEYEGFLAATCVTDIYYIQRRFYHDQEKAKNNLTKILKLYSIIDITESDCQNALRSDIPDYEDAVLVESASRNNIDCIVTRNTKDFKNSRIPVYTPVEFLEILKNS